MNRTVRLFSCVVMPGLLFASAVRAAHAESFAGKVVGVVDGDTITVMRDDSEAVSESSPGPLQGPHGVRRGSPKRVRLYGVDAPEIGQDYGIRARRLVQALTGGRDVIVECKGTDEYERILADVILSGRIMLNREIIRAGYAWHYGSKDKILKRLQAKARKKGMGLWAAENPVAPWVYRRLLKEQASTRTSSPAEQTVYVTKTGKKYHRAGCRSLRKGRIPMTIEEAVKKGYKPCGICRPPSLDLSRSGSPLPEAEGRPPSLDLSGSDPTLPVEVTPARGEGTEQTVYVTKTGKKYHRAGCRSLRKGRIPMTLEDAVEKSYKPCGICSPVSADLLGTGSPSP